MLADGVALADGGNLDLFFRSCRRLRLKKTAQRDGRSGRRIFLLRMMALDDARGVSIFERRRGRSCYFEENVYADGKIAGVHKARARLLDIAANVGQLRRPSRCPNHHVFALAKAGSDVLHNRRGGGEINYDVNIFQRIGGEGGGVSIFRAGQGANIVSTLLRDLGNQRTGLPPA